MLTAWQRTQLSHKTVTQERKSGRECKNLGKRMSLRPSNAYAPRPGRGPGSCPGTGEQRTTASRPCRSKSGVKTGLDMKEVDQEARDAQQHDPVMSASEILSSTK
ncbi:hypothetical protein N7508_004131 [Penicillium antarcticum]|uniref:uncharacterized protein n=1 Tax=Penicillium antarcticum TaxID=416450 RepID=UPI0023834C21|nr:uncharacterized protein N7508_004131 [Penicillium antarcticum]KAJ5308752.1 hypothetical protein N7508_004131 [Penicillium antarcticum]